MFVAKKKSGINSIQDFAGKKIAIWRTAMVELTTGFLKEQNIDANVIRINDGVNIFLKDAVDVCVIMYYNEYNKLINFGMDPEDLNVFYLKDYKMNFPEDGIYCMSDTYNKDPDLCAKFVKASIEGWVYSLAHPEETLQIMKVFQRQENIVDNKTHSEWMLNAMNDQLKPAGKKAEIGELKQEDYNNAVQFLKRNNWITTPIKYDDFYRGAIKND
jgi:NitT/TauT family transport system substrate-binding protein